MDINSRQPVRLSAMNHESSMWSSSKNSFVRAHFITITIFLKLMVIVLHDVIRDS